MPAPAVPNARIGSDPQQAQQQAQQGVRAALAQLFQNSPLLDGKLVGPFQLKLGYHSDGTAYPVDTPAPHALGRKPKGWLVVDLTDNAQVWRSSADNKQPASNLLLSHDATSPVSVTLWVF